MLSPTCRTSLLPSSVYFVPTSLQDCLRFRLLVDPCICSLHELLNPELLDSEMPQFACTRTRRNRDCCCAITSHKSLAPAVPSLSTFAVFATHPPLLAARRRTLPHPSCVLPMSGSMRHTQCSGFPFFSSTAVVDRRVSRSLAQSLSPNAMHSSTSFWYAQTY